MLYPIYGEYVGHTYELNENRTLLGRHGSCDIVLTHPEISRRHACIDCEDGVYFIRDLGSTNATFVNGQRLRQRRRLEPADVIHLGPVELEFQPGSVRDTDPLSMSSSNEGLPAARPSRPGILSDAAEDLRAGAKSTEEVQVAVKALLQLIRSLDLAQEVDDVNDQILTVMARLFPQSGRLCVFISDSDGALQLRAIHCCHDSGSGSQTLPLISRDLAREAIESGRTLLKEGQGQKEHTESVFDGDGPSFMCAPLQSRENQKVGAICVASRTAAQPFSEDDVEMLRSAAIMIGHALGEGCRGGR